MKNKYYLLVCAIVLLPSLVLGVSNSANGQSNGNSSSATQTTSPVATTTNQGQNQSENRTQSQTNNPEIGAMTQEQAEVRLQEQIEESKPEYTPKNQKASEHRSVVANATEQLIRLASQTENAGIGDQIRLIAQTQTKNQDKIGQSIDKVTQRTSLAKFFIGSNYAELKEVKSSITENQSKIEELQQIMTQMTEDADKLSVADQIILLQDVQIDLIDQVEDLSGGFSLFGWLNRWINRY